MAIEASAMNFVFIRVRGFTARVASGRRAVKQIICRGGTLGNRRVVQMPFYTLYRNEVAPPLHEAAALRVANGSRQFQQPGS